MRNFIGILVFTVVMSSTGFAAGVPTSIAYQGYLKDSLTGLVTASKDMKFGIYIAGTRIWYARYSAVAVTNGYFQVNLGASEQGAQSLDPVGGGTGGGLTVEADLFTGLASAVPVEISVELYNGSTYELFPNRFPINSTLFSLKSESIGGFKSDQLAKLDSSGRIMSASGVPVVSSDGNWIGSASGLQGPQGIPGPVGSPGPQGSTGPKGDAGDAGTAGVPGETGAVGPMGPQGFQGEIGLTGPAGLVGATGGVGPQGPVGAIGSIGPVGPQGLQGIAGPVGSTGVAGAVGPMGPQGFQGEIGLTGPAGLVGATGGVGPQGPVGATGSIGPVGPQGLQGVAGPVGSAGVAGAVGPMGPQGFQGEIGLTGPAGLVGATGGVGPQGPVGATGSIGPVGPQGLQGIAGPKGDSGDTGPVGMMGPAGATGQNGLVGPAGPQGLQGLPGVSGSNTVFWRGLGMTARTFTAFGGNKLSYKGSASAQVFDEGHFVSYTSTLTIKAVGVYGASYVDTQVRLRPVLKAVIRTDSSLANQRLWVALTSADLSATDGVGALTQKFVGLRYSTAAGDSVWQCVSGNGTVGSMISTGVGVLPNTAYKMELNWSSAGELRCIVNGVSTSKTNELNAPEAATIGLQIYLNSLDSSVKTNRINSISMSYLGLMP